MTNQEALQAMFGKPQPGADVYKALLTDYKNTLSAVRYAETQARAQFDAANNYHDTQIVPLLEGTSGFVFIPLMQSNQDIRMNLNAVTNELLAYENRLTGWAGSFTSAKEFEEQEAEKPQPEKAIVAFMASLPPAPPAVTLPAAA